MARRIGFLQPIPAEDANAESPALARVIQSLAGGAAYLYELVAGVPVSNDSQVTPPNPQGEIGLDMSGPPWGSAFRHPIAWIGGMTADTAETFGRDSVLKVPEGGEAQIGPWCFWVRPFEHLPSPWVAPYSFGRLDMRGHHVSATAGSISWEARNLTIDPSGSPDFASATSMDVDVLELTDTEDQLSTSTIPLVPGWNTIVIAFRNETDGDVYIDNVVINQTVKRTH